MYFVYLNRRRRLRIKLRKLLWRLISLVGSRARLPKTCKKVKQVLLYYWFNTRVSGRGTLPEQ